MIQRIRGSPRVDELAPQPDQVRLGESIDRAVAPQFAASPRSFAQALRDPPVVVERRSPEAVFLLAAENELVASAPEGLPVAWQGVGMLIKDLDRRYSIW
jgi:hypothetical protein